MTSALTQVCSNPKGLYYPSLEGTSQEPLSLCQTTYWQVSNPQCYLYKGIVNMLRLKPTAIVITTPEMADAERRSRYRKHLIKRQGGDRGHAKTSASKNEGVAFEDAINTMIQTDTNSDSGQGFRSLSSPEMSAREERVPVISSPDGSIDGEAHTLPLRSRTQFDNMINDVTEQHEDEEDADRQQLATAVSWSFRQNWPSPRQQVFITT